MSSREEETVLFVYSFGGEESGELGVEDREECGHALSFTFVSESDSSSSSHVRLPC